jgi:hypothetical protein
MSWPGEMERLFMEQFDTDLQAMVREPRPTTPGSRLNVLLIFPAIGILLMLILVLSAIFQFEITVFIDSLMGLMTLFFLVLVAMLFWAMAPRGDKA